jgi:hypothetical protein
LILDWTEEINTDPENLHIELVDGYGTVDAQVCNISITPYEGSAIEDGETYLILASVGPRGMDTHCNVSVDLTFRLARKTSSEYRVFINPQDKVWWVQQRLRAIPICTIEQSTTDDTFGSDGDLSLKIPTVTSKLWHADTYCTTHSRTAMYLSSGGKVDSRHYPKEQTSEAWPLALVASDEWALPSVPMLSSLFLTCCLFRT